MNAGLVDELYGNSDIIGGADTSVGVGVFAILLIMLGIAIVCCLVSLVIYVVWCLGTYRLAKKLDVEKPFLAWIPYAQYWTLGQIAEKCDARRGNTAGKPWGKYFLFSALISVAAGLVLGTLGGIINAFIPGVGVLLTLPASLLSYLPLIVLCICCWKIYHEFFSETTSIVLFIVSILCSAYSVILLIASFRELNPAEVVEPEEKEPVTYTYDFQG